MAEPDLHVEESGRPLLTRHARPRRANAGSSSDVFPLQDRDYVYPDSAARFHRRERSKLVLAVQFASETRRAGGRPTGRDPARDHCSQCGYTSNKVNRYLKPLQAEHDDFLRETAPSYSANTVFENLRQKEEAEHGRAPLSQSTPNRENTSV